MKTDDNAEGHAKGIQSLGTQWTDFNLMPMKTNSMPRVVPRRNGGLDIQQTVMPMVVSKTASTHNKQTSI